MASPLTDIAQPSFGSPDNDTLASPTASLHGSVRTTSSHSSQVQRAQWDQEDQEAEAVLTQQVEQLCQILWPAPDTFKQRFASSQIGASLRANRIFQYFIPALQLPVIERLKGGDLNHITRITLPTSYSQKDRHLILRVPRWNQKRLDREVATLEYVRQKTLIPVATVARTDFSCNNPFEKPYVLQHQVFGRDLNTMWNNLNHAQRCTVATELGRVFRKLLSLQAPVSGVIEKASENAENAHSFRIVPFDLDIDLDEITDETKEKIKLDMPVPRAPQTTLDVFRSQFGRWKAVALAHSCGEVNTEVELLDSMLKAVNEMNDLGLFDENSNCLCHVDLHQGNIMARIQSDNSLEIAAILDWDEAVFAPNFVCCHPPAWLWGYEYADQVDEDDSLPWPYELAGANEVPSTLEQQELKRLFEESAGPEYSRLAYDELYRLCRGLFRIAKDGLEGNSQFDAAERILKEWEVLRQSLTTN
jgi:aminoglycoside phosphotransferase (APT) family kinase protein